MKDYTPDELIEICTTDPRPEVRRIAARMLYTMGERDQAAKSLQLIRQPADQVPA